MQVGDLVRHILYKNEVSKEENFYKKLGMVVGFDGVGDCLAVVAWGGEDKKLSTITSYYLEVISESR